MAHDEAPVEQDASTSEGTAVPRRRPLTVGSLAATAFAVVVLVVATVVCGLLAIGAALVSRRGDLGFKLARLWGRSLLLAAGIRVETVVEPGLERDQPYVFLANHQSMMDIPVLFASLPRQARFVAKRSLFQIPLFGWAVRALGFIPVERGDRERARESFGAAAERLASGVSVLFFPEGTRSPDASLLEFKRGGFLLAIKHQLAIVPVGIAGTRRVLPRGSVRILPGRVKVTYCRPVESTEYGVRRRRELMQHVRETIERARREPKTANQEMP